MGIIRLILITAALIWLAMYYFGRDEGLPENRLGRAPAPADLAEVSQPEASGAAPEPAEAPEPPAGPEANQTALAEAAPAGQPAAEPAAPEPVAEPEPEPEPELPAEPEPAPEPTPETVLYVTGRAVNVRSGASTAFEAITSLTRGAAVVDLGDAGEGWRQILLDTGEIGFMSGDFLSPDPQ